MHGDNDRAAQNGDVLEMPEVWPVFDSADQHKIQRLAWKRRVSNRERELTMTDDRNKAEKASSLQCRVRTLRWFKTKPTKPGEYYTRHASDGSCVNTVVVTKAGRGLSVYCAAYNDRVPMSLIGDTELEWAERPNNKLTDA